MTLYQTGGCAHWCGPQNIRTEPATCLYRRVTPIMQTKSLPLKFSQLYVSKGTYLRWRKLRGLTHDAHVHFKFVVKANEWRNRHINARYRQLWKKEKGFHLFDIALWSVWYPVSACVNVSDLQTQCFMPVHVRPRIFRRRTLQLFKASYSFMSNNPHNTSRVYSLGGSTSHFKPTKVGINRPSSCSLSKPHIWLFTKAITLWQSRFDAID